MPNKKQISVVLPVYNEENIIEELLSEIEQNVDDKVEFVIVNDGSSDSTYDRVNNYKLKNKGNIKKAITLSRNYGHQQALMCGLDNVSEKSDLIIVMDSDFQDDPKDLKELINKINQGYDCVYAVRKKRKEGIMLNLLMKLFYRIQNKLVPIAIPKDAGTFSVFNRQVLCELLKFKETDIYFPGLRAYVGFKQEGVMLERGQRHHGKSRVGIAGLLDLSIVAILHFSGVPMRIIFLSGFFMMVFCIILSVAVLVMKVTGFTKIPGVTTTLIIMMMLSGVQIMFIGIVGEYIGKMFREVKNRPRWIVKEIIDG